MPVFKQGKMKRKDFRTIIHNPGYDFVRELELLNDEIRRGSKPNTSIYFGPVLGVLFACCGIEGYINYVGTRIKCDWITKTSRFESIRSKIERLFKGVNREINFQDGIFKDTVDLFVWRRRLVHPEYARKKQNQINEIPDIFDETSKIYPVNKSFKIANEFKKIILKEFHIKDMWQLKSKNIPIDIMEMETDV